MPHKTARKKEHLMLSFCKKKKYEVAKQVKCGIICCKIMEDLNIGDDTVSGIIKSKNNVWSYVANAAIKLSNNNLFIFKDSKQITDINNPFTTMIHTAHHCLLVSHTIMHFIHQYSSTRLWETDSVILPHREKLDTHISLSNSCSLHHSLHGEVP